MGTYEKGLLKIELEKVFKTENTTWLSLKGFEKIMYRKTLSIHENIIDKCFKVDVKM